MTKIILTPEQKQLLEIQHRVERDGRIRDRMKAVLLSSEGWSHSDISKALRIRPETVSDHLADYVKLAKLKPENGGSSGYLSEFQCTELIAHLEEHLYVRASDICAYVDEHYGFKFTVPGVIQWLHRHMFSYKNPKGLPSKAEPGKQQEFIDYYDDLLANTSENEPVLFGDGVHPTMATKVSCGWIRRGKEKIIPTKASRTRVNLFGSLNLETMELLTESDETIDSVAMRQHFCSLRNHYPNAPKIHLILDQGPYNISAATKEAAEEYQIKLHYLPVYSPNLNPIERCWKVMNEHARNNHHFKQASEFKQAISHFFEVTWPQISQSLVDRINDNFQVINRTSSG